MTQTLEEYVGKLSDSEFARFMSNFHNGKQRAHMRQARYWRSEQRYGLMSSQLVSARVESAKARVALREARRLENEQ